MDMNNEKFEMIKDIGSGNFGVAKLMKDRYTNELVAVKFIERGEKIDKCASHRAAVLWLPMNGTLSGLFLLQPNKLGSSVFT